MVDRPIRKICFFSGKRGGFNHFVPLFEQIEAEKELNYSLVVSDMHLSSFFGDTVEEVRRWAKNVLRVETLMGSDSKVSRAKSIGVGILGMADLLAREAPDLLVVLGDRGEILAPVICAMQLNIPVAHLFGGDLTQGGVDECVRHGVTKFSNLHFAATQDSADRIVRMGEEPWRVHNVGSPVLDLVRKRRFTSRKEVCEKYGVDPGKPLAVLVQHPVTWQVESAGEQIQETLRALESLKIQTVAVYPCSDPGYSAIVDALESVRDKPWFRLHSNIDFQDFWGLMDVAGVFVGNSSAGILETPSFKLPTVNIGIRQEGRLRSDNVIDAPHDSTAIRNAIQRALHTEFREKVQHCLTPYGDGHAAERIVRVLLETPVGERLLHKKMTY
ncbi:MAG: UDP-N-acetylglucosamine 2-epimerase [Desulfovibrio sp.]